MISGPIPDVRNQTVDHSNPMVVDLAVRPSDPMVTFWMQLSAISYATRALFLGQAILNFSLTDNRPASQPSFLEIPISSDVARPQFVWGDVLKGIEEMSHNVTAALLTLQLGTMSANCSIDHQAVVYQYTAFALWVPYGVSNCPLLSCNDMTFPLLCFIDRLGHCFNFTRCCCHDDGEK
jgi:hypothetical protein